MMLRIGGGGGGSPVTEEKGYISPGKTSLDRTADVRDLIGALVGGGVRQGSEDFASKYNLLKRHLGDSVANKLVNHIFINNSRPDVQGLPVEKRIQQFYDIGSSDEDLKKVLGDVKSFGYGVIPGFRESSLMSNQKLAGRVGNETAGLDDEAARKILLKVAKKM